MINEFDAYLDKIAQEIIIADQMEKEASAVGEIAGKVKDSAVNFGKDVLGRRGAIKDLKGRIEQESKIGQFGNKEVYQAKLENAKSAVRGARIKAGVGVAAAGAGAGAGALANFKGKEAPEFQAQAGTEDDEAIEVTASHALIQANAMREAALETLFEAELMKQAAEEVLIPLMAKEAGIE